MGFGYAHNFVISHCDTKTFIILKLQKQFAGTMCKTNQTKIPDMDVFSSKLIAPRGYKMISMTEVFCGI